MAWASAFPPFPPSPALQAQQYLQIFFVFIDVMQLQYMWMLDELQDGNLSLHLQRNHVTAHSQPQPTQSGLAQATCIISYGCDTAFGAELHREISAVWTLLSQKAREEPMPGQGFCISWQ